MVPVCPIVVRRDRIPVKDRSGETRFWVTPEQALRMIERGYVPRGTKTAIRAIQLPAKYDESKVTPLTAYTGQHYSHSHATEQNPEGVWTLRHLSNETEPIFRRVQLEAMGKLTPQAPTFAPAPTLPKKPRAKGKLIVMPSSARRKATKKPKTLKRAA